MSPHPLKRLLSVLGPQAVEHFGALQALRTFHLAAATVPAYRSLLENLRVPVRRIWSIDDFTRHVPVIDADSYLRQFPLEMLCRNGRLHGKHVLEYGCGPAGAPGIWPLEPSEDRHLRNSIACLFRDMFDARRLPTLVIVTWPHESGLTGEHFARTVRNLAESGRLKLTVAAPGTRMEQTQELLDRFLGGFPQTLLAGRPPFLQDVVQQAGRRGIRWADHRVHLLCGPEPFSESWRDDMARALEIAHVDRRRAAHIIACHAPAEPSIAAAAETPFALLVRRLAAGDRGLCRDLFASSCPPAVFQYDPARLWAEGIDGELVLTCRGAVPLVRFNTHEPGDALACQHALTTLSDHGYDPGRLLLSLGWPHELHHRLPLLCVRMADATTVSASDTSIATRRRHEALTGR